MKRAPAAPLGGMGISFSSSLFGLAGSLILGFLDLQTSQAQNRFYTNLEDWLATTVQDLGAGANGGGALPGSLREALHKWTPAELEKLRKYGPPPKQMEALRKHNAALYRSLQPPEQPRLDTPFEAPQLPAETASSHRAARAARLSSTSDAAISSWAASPDRGFRRADDLRVHIDVPLAGGELLRLLGSERGFSLDRGLDRTAFGTEPDHRRTVLARRRRSVEMGHGGRPRQPAVAEGPG